MIRILTIATVALAVVLLLPLLPLLAEPVRPQPVAVPAAAGPLHRQTVASLRALARRRGVRTVAGVPVVRCRKAALLAALS